jgi:hypothetical protein
MRAIASVMIVCSLLGFAATGAIASGNSGNAGMGQSHSAEAGSSHSGSGHGHGNHNSASAQSTATSGASSCPASAGFMKVANTPAGEHGRVNFANQTACQAFLRHNPTLSAVPGSVTSTSTTPPAPTGTAHGNSQAAHFCPKNGGTVNFKSVSGSQSGNMTFKNHGECVSFFAQNRNLQIVTK